MAAKRPTLLSKFETKLGPPSAWAGRCSDIAIGAVEHRLVPKGSVAARGHWLGPVHPKSMFAASSAAGFVQHGWVKQPDGTVCDPTRWVFEHAPPYIYVGPSDHYDEGGNGFRMRRLGGAPVYDPKEAQSQLLEAGLPKDAWACFARLLGSTPKPGVVSGRQLHWLANLDPRALGGHAWALYTTLDSLNLRGLIPYDNFQMVKRDAQRKSDQAKRRRSL